MAKQYKTLTDGQLTADPGSMEPADSHLESVKPLSDEIPISIPEPTTLSKPRDDGPVSESRYQKHLVFTVVYLGDTVKECSRGVGSMSLEQLEVKE